MLLKNSDLEFLLKRSNDIVSEFTIIVLGSQSILGSFSSDDLPNEATQSIEADICVLEDSNFVHANEIDIELGEFSPIHDQYGIYAQGVEITTADLPEGWNSRLIPFKDFSSGEIIGYCLDPLDICASKAVAHREKDMLYLKSLFDAKLIAPEKVCEKVDMIDDSSLTNPNGKLLAYDFLKAFKN